MFSSRYSNLVYLVYWYFFLQFFQSSLCAVDPPTISVLSTTFVPNITFTDELNRSMIVYLPDYVLRLNIRPLALELRNDYFSADGGLISEQGFQNCHFVGTVENFENWMASISICNGMMGNFGLMEDPNNFFHIEPRSNSTYHQLDELHILYSESFADSVDRNTYYGICDPSLVREEDRFSRPDDEVDFEEFDPEIAASTQQRFVELLIVNDNKLYQNRRRSLNNVIQRDLVIVDYLNELYKGFGVKVVLKSVMTWSNGDAVTFPRNNDPTSILKIFQNYVRENIDTKNFDAALLISGRNFLGNVVGLAYKSSMCYGPFSVGIVQDTMNAIVFGGGTASHELGHILGMSHDDNDRSHICTCSDRTGKCIMAGLSLSTPATTWSACSGNEMFTTFQNNPMTETCLMNVPEMNNFTLFSHGTVSHTWAKNMATVALFSITILL